MYVYECVVCMPVCRHVHADDRVVNVHKHIQYSSAKTELVS